MGVRFPQLTRDQFPFWPTADIEAAVCTSNQIFHALDFTDTVVSFHTNFDGLCIVTDEIEKL